MQVNNQALSLFDYIENRNKANETLDNLGKRQKLDLSESFASLNQGLNADKFEDTLKRLEKGEIDLDGNSVEHYLSFNLNKLEKEVQSIRRQFDVSDKVAIKIEDNKLTIEGDDNERLQYYLDQNQALQKLVNQTSRLSKFVEWSEAKSQAAEFKEQGMDEDKLVEFLKDSRKVVTESDHLLVSNNAFGFDSQGYAKSVIDKYTEKKQTE